MRKEVTSFRRVPKYYRQCFIIITKDSTSNSLVCYPVGIHMIVLLWYKINKQIGEYFSPIVTYRKAQETK